MVFLGLLFYSSPQLVILGNEYNNMFSESVNLSVCWFSLASFIFPSCTKPLFQSQAKYEAIDMKTIHKNGFAPIVASFWKREFLELGNGLFEYLQWAITLSKFSFILFLCNQ